MKTFNFYLLLFLFGYSTLLSQDVTFINSNQSLINLNPSFAGSNGLIRNQFLYRNQWPQLSGSYQTLTESFDAYLKPLHAGVGINYSYNDQGHGLWRSHQYSLIYAQHIRICERIKIIPSFQVTYCKKMLDLNRLSFQDVNNLNQGFVNSWTEAITSAEKNYFEGSAGLLVKVGKRFYGGFSAFHLNQPDHGLLGSEKLPIRLTFNAAYTIPICEKAQVQFASTFMRQNKYNSLSFAVNALLIKHLLLSLAYRNNDDLLVALGFRNNFMSLMAGYDIVVSKLAGNTLGSWELSSSFNLRKKELRKSLTLFEEM